MHYIHLYLQKMARQHAVKGVARTFVLIDDLYPSEILGFFTLSICELHAEVFQNHAAFPSKNKIIFLYKSMTSFWPPSFIIC